MLAVTLSSPAAAHHSAAQYDDHKSTRITGTVTRYIWGNPHVYIYVAQLADGEKIEWEVEGSPPSILRRLGWSQTTLHAGDSVTVIGRPAKDPARKALLPTSIQLGDKTLFDRKSELGQLASSATAAQGHAQGIEGVWVTLLDPQLEERLDEEKMPLTPKGRDALKHFDEKTMHPGAHCVPYPAPIFMLSPDLKRITRKDTVVLIDSEFDAAQRTIHMDITAHDGAPASNQGHSIGRWEGTSLYIDTTRFADTPVGNGVGVPSGPGKHLVERLTPSPDGKTLSYHFELSDPEYIATPITGEVKWVFQPTAVYAPLKCNPDNARHFTLRGARSLGR